MIILAMIFIKININISYLQKLCSKYRIYPSFIEDENDMDVVINKKRQFQSSFLNYILDKDYYLCYLHIKEDKKFDLKKRKHNNFH